MNFRVCMMIVLLLALAAAGPIQAQGAVTPNIPYVPDSDASQQLDVYLPATGRAPYPTLLLLHGGGFIFGDKSQLAPYAAYFTARGYAVVSMNYRLSPINVFPAAVQDSFCALGWVYANAATYGFNTRKLVAIGESAGGYLSTLLATVDNPKTYLDGCPFPVPVNHRLRGVVDYYPLTGASFDSYPLPTLLSLYAFRGVTTGQLDVLRAQWPGIPDLDGNEPPFLLIHGTGDDVVPAHDSGDLRDRLQAVGVRADLTLLPDVDHGFISLLEEPAAQQAAQTVEAFLKSIGA